MHFIKRTKIDPNAAISLEMDVGFDLILAGQCSRYVVIASPSYGMAGYACDVVIEAKALLAWICCHAARMGSSSHDWNVSIWALPIWLRGADVDAPCLSYLPKRWINVFEDYLPDIVKLEGAHVHCHYCNEYYQKVDEISIEERGSTLNRPKYLFGWQCGNGHTIYLEDQEMHLNIR